MTENAPSTLTIRLDAVITAIDQARTDPLGRLSEAVQASQYLGDVADHLVGHFVDEARRSGASWADIGAGLGVSKQAVQKRFVPRDTGQDPLAGRQFERFNELALTALRSAQDDARRMGVEYVDTEHLLSGLNANPRTIAVRVVTSRDVSFETWDQAVIAAIDRTMEEHGTGPRHGDNRPVKRLPYTAAMLKVMELAVREALRLGHESVGTEHLLLGLLLVDDSPGSQVLADLGLTHADAEEQIVEQLRVMGGRDVLGEQELLRRAQAEDEE